VKKKETKTTKKRNQQGKVVDKQIGDKTKKQTNT
jgi:hypothetical protein